MIAPKSLALARKPRVLPLALTADRPGSVTLALVRPNGKVVATGRTTFTRAGTVGFELKLPRKLLAGPHALRITFTPAGATAGTTKSLTVRFKAPPRKKRKAGVAEGPRLVGARPWASP